VSERAVGALSAAIAAALFGSSYVATAFQLRGFTPLGAAAWRMGLAALVLVAVFAVQARGGRSDGSAAAAPSSAYPLGARIARFVAIGVLGGLVFIVGMNQAVSMVGATVTAFVAGLYAITAALFAAPILGERLRTRIVVGFVVALVGTVLLAELAPSADALGGLLWGGLAAISFGLYLVLVRRWSKAIAVGPVGIAIATTAMSAIGLVVALALIAPGQLTPFRVTPEVAGATAWLVFVAAAGPLFTTIALHRIEAALASSMLLLNPITATILAALLLAELPSPPQLLGGALVLVGMAAATDLVGAVRRRRRIPG
jgi:drug/metabolite transporter (DMT)-like permease